MKISSSLNKKDVFVLVICLFFMLAALGSTGRMGRENAKRVICASNIQKSLMASTSFAREHEGKYPYNWGIWPWDADCDTVNLLLEYMGVDVSQIEQEQDNNIPVQDIFYCPSNIPQRKARDIYWNHHFPSLRILSYVYLFRSVLTIYVENQSETELVVDAVLSQRKNRQTGETYNLNEFPNGNFGQITNGAMEAYYGYYDSSSHLKSLKEPYGGNIGFVDGHVQWRDFKDMANRITTSSVGPMWWW